ncbi:MAG: large conductance mechanosensitive channel protein MscL [Bacilli bacterium]|nr:large conductance mechanosensitive channel protein MscL [Bacilli bacterium]
MRKFFKEFGQFIQRGNVLDLAIGVIIGGAFGKIIASLVKDVLMPVIGLFVGGNLAEMHWVLTPEEVDLFGVVTKPATTLNYGLFIQTIIDFLIIAFVIFIIIKAIMKARMLAEKAKAEKEAEQVQEEVVAEPVPSKPTAEELLVEIRDLLAKQKE